MIAQRKNITCFFINQHIRFKVCKAIHTLRQQFQIIDI